MSNKTINELEKAGIFIGSDFMADIKNKSHIDTVGKRKNFLPDSKGILLGRTIKESGKKPRI